MKQIIVRVRDIFSPDDKVILTKIGDKYIIEKANPEKVLNIISEKFKELSAEEKINLALEAKKWARK